MAFANVQIGANVNGTGSVALTVPAASTAGTLLVACMFNTSGAAFSAPGGWQFAKAVSQGSVSRTAIWYYPNNPGGITSATFTSSGNCRGTMAEFSTAAGTTQNLDQTGSNNGAAPATSFAITAGGSSGAGDLGIAAYGDSFSASQTGQSWTLPTGYTVIHNQANVTVNYSASYKTGLASGIQSVTASYSSSTNQNGWTGCFAAFSEVAATALSVATTSLPAGQAGVGYQAALAATGGVPPYSWAVTVGTLPAGLSLAATGGRGGLFGVTAYMTGVSPDNAILNWETAVGVTCTSRKCYFTSGQFPTVPDVHVQSALDENLTAYLCYRPAYNPPTTSDYNALQASLQALQALGLKAKVILYQEVENQAPTAAQYKSLLSFYAPAVHAVYPGGLVHDSAGSRPLLWASYFPGSLGVVDEYGIDFYAPVYANGNRIDKFVALVAGTGKPFGVLEMGSALSTVNGGATPPDAVVTAYLQYLNGLAAANPPGAFMWYQQDNKEPANVISDPSDFRVPLLQQIQATIAGTTVGAGVISGTPTTAGTSSFTVRVTDTNASTATQAESITISAAAPPVITTTSLPAATTGVAYSQALAVTGGTAPLTWTVSDGALPDGLTLDPALGVISGTPTSAAATSGFTATVTDFNNLADDQILFIAVVAGLPVPNPAPNPLGFPQVIIEAGLGAAAPQVPAGTFLLDDPVYGVLDTDRLGDATMWTDIAGFFRSGTISRPSTRVQGPLITYQGGTATGTFDNTGGQLDPDNPSGPYAGALRPMVPFQARAVYGSVSYPMWAGFTSSFAGSDLTYDMGYDEVTINADDGFKILAGITIPASAGGGQPGGAGDGEDTGTRVTRILNAAGWYTDHRRITTGDSTVQGTSFGDTALNLLQLTADNEIGELYMDGAGNVVFRHRQALLEDARSSQVQAVFGDLPGTVHGAFTELACIPHRRAADDTTLANDIQATTAGGTLQRAQNKSSQRTYLFPRSYARTDLILEDDATAKAWAQWVLTVSKDMDDRFDAITIDPLADPANLFPQVLGREIGDRIQVWRRPQNSGATITQDCFIRGIRHDVDAVNGTWSTTWDLQSAARYTGFLILDDTVNGKLDTGKLAF